MCECYTKQLDQTLVNKVTSNVHQTYIKQDPKMVGAQAPLTYMHGETDMCNTEYTQLHQTHFIFP